MTDDQSYDEEEIIDGDDQEYDIEEEIIEEEIIVEAPRSTNSGPTDPPSSIEGEPRAITQLPTVTPPETTNLQKQSSLPSPSPPPPPPPPEPTGPQDPPGFSIPMPSVQQIDWWAYQQQQIQDQKRRSEEQNRIKERLRVARAKPHPIPRPMDEHSSTLWQNQQLQQRPIQQYSYKKYLKANPQSNNDDTNTNNIPKPKSEKTRRLDEEFAWVPPPSRSNDRSPDGTAAPFRTIASQRVYETSIPHRSWSVEDEDDSTSAESSMIANKNEFPKSSWAIPKQHEKQQQQQHQQQQQNDDSDSYIEEEIVEDFLDKVVIPSDIPSEIPAEIPSECSSSSSSFTRSHKSLRDRLPNESASPVIEASFAKNKKGHKNKKSMKSTRPHSQRNGGEGPTTDVPPNNKARANGRRHKHNHRHNPKSRSKSTPHGSTSSSASTQVIFIHDDRDLKEIVQKCFNGNVRVEDQDVVDNATCVDIGEGDELFFAPSRGVLILLGMLVFVMFLAIVVGLALWAMNRTDR